MDKMQARSSARRTMATAASQKPQEHEVQPMLEVLSETQSLAGVANGQRRRRSASQVSASSEELPIAVMPGATPPMKRSPGHPRKSSPNTSSLALEDLSHKRPLEATSDDAQAQVISRPKTQPTKAKSSPKIGESVASPTSPVKRVKKAVPTKAVSTSASSMPDYASWRPADLQAETGKYGYKPSASKAVLVGQLTRIWEALHPCQSANAPASKKQPKLKKAKAVVAPAADGSEGDASAVVPQKKVRRPRKPASSDDDAPTSKAVRKKATKAKDAEDDIDVVSDPEDVRTAGERLREAILADEAFYLRLLRYEVRQLDYRAGLMI